MQMDWIYGDGGMENNYFKILEMEPCFLSDKKELRRNYLKLSAKFHPDNFSLEDEAKQAQSLKEMTWVNEAYKVLNDSDKTFEYILFSNGYGHSKDQNFDGAFLMQMMEWNENVEEIQNEHEKIKLEQMLHSEFENLKLEVNPIFSKSFDSISEEEWKKLENYYFKYKYFLRIREKISTFAPL